MKTRLCYLKIFSFSVMMLLIVSALGVTINVKADEDQEGYEDQRNTPILGQRIIPNNAPFSSTYWYAQEFVPSKDQLTRVRVYLLWTGQLLESPSVKLSIREDDKDGDDLTACSVDNILWDITTWPIDFNFPDITVTPGKTYYIVVELHKYLGSYHRISASTDKYKSGIGWEKGVTIGGGWKKISGVYNPNTFAADLKFITYGYNSSEVPSAFIDSIIVEGELVTFEGYGEDPYERDIVGYEWSSSIDGVFGSTATVEISTLTVGLHEIYFRVKNEKGLWSEKVRQDLKIGNINIPPVINSITITPPNPVVPEDKVDVEVTFSCDAKDPDGFIKSHAWYLDNTLVGSTPAFNKKVQKGIHTIELVVKDDKDATAERTLAFNVGPNEPPLKPTIWGKTSGDATDPYYLEVSAEDPDGDDVYYYVAWNYVSDDKEDLTDTSKWYGPFPSGITQTIEHTYWDRESYEIRVKATDTSPYDSERWSGWSDPLEITMPKNGEPKTRAILLLSFFERFLDNHPMFRVLLLL